MRCSLPLASLLCLLATASAIGQIDPSADHLPGTEPLVMEEPLDVVMVRGINYFAEREIADSPNRRPAKWNRDYSSPEAYAKSVEPNRQRLKEIIGAVDERVAARQPAFVLPQIPAFGDQLILAQQIAAVVVRWDVLPGVSAEGIMLIPETVSARVILLPDADWRPELMYGRAEGLAAEQQTGLRLAQSGCQVLIATLISRSDELSGHPDIRFTNQPHREYIYRMAFEMGRHIVGYEVLKVLSAVDWLQLANVAAEVDLPLAVVGLGEGGLIALQSAAIDPRIDATLVSGYFQHREGIWHEPIYRNIWAQLSEFGDAEIASLIAPRRLVIEACSMPEISGPPMPHDGRAGGAAPGRIATAEIEAVRAEVATARHHFVQLGKKDELVLVESSQGHSPHGTSDALSAFLEGMGIELAPLQPASFDPAVSIDPEQCQQRQVRELVDYTQKLLHRSDKARDKVWANVDRSSIDKCVASLEAYRDMVYDQMIGRLPEPTLPLNPRTRKVIDEETHVGYEVVLDCYPAGDTERPIPDGADVKVPDTGSVDRIGWAVGKDWGVIAGGILLLPKDLKVGERRPVVVCQHGLEGVPMDTIDTDPNAKGYGPYKGFSTALVKRGFIVYVPQNPYRGHDAFRVIQRKSNPMGRSLFSYIIPQHARTLEWLASLPYVDRDRIAFYGLSYGGKTAVRVPPMLPPGRGSRVKSQGNAGSTALDSGPSALDPPGYCLSICSADFNEWVRKNTSSEDRYSYVYTPEYEIFEWNMGHVANYAELSYLMTPRPFMVERGHDDGVAPDEWVAWEYAKVKRHYDRLGLGDQTELEVFNGPHTINGVGTYAFLHKHLNWPER